MTVAPSSQSPAATTVEKLNAAVYPDVPQALSKRAQAEFLRRCGKLLLHELGHLYGIHHCIYHRCLMMGTGHLVEDFGAPFHVCGICLRKLQWRLGFSVVQRYRDLAVALKQAGLTKEASWMQRQVASILQRKAPTTATTAQEELG